jgi:hypothetical protein
MAIRCLKREIFLWTAALWGHLEVIEFPIERQDTPTRSWGKLDPELFQCRAYTILTKFGIDLQTFHFLHGQERCFGSRLVRPTQFVRKPGELFFDPSFEGRMDRLPRRV